MEEMMNRNASAQNALLEGLALQAQTFAANIAANLIQLGRVFTEAKPLIRHGEWENWVARNAGMSIRYAQNCMAAYQRFGTKEVYASMDKSKLFALLSLPEGTEDSFTHDNDIAAMTARQVKEAVAKERALAEAARRALEARNEQLAIDLDGAMKRADAADKRADRAADEAERKIAEMRDAEPQVPQDFLDRLDAANRELAKERMETERFRTVAEDAMSEKNRINHSLVELRAQLTDAEDALDEAQHDLDAAHKELLDFKSQAARGDAERAVGGRLTAQEFAGAVRVFLGTCAPMPMMAKDFAAMKREDWQVFSIFLASMEDFTARARQALESVEGGCIHVR